MRVSKLSRAHEHRPNLDGMIVRSFLVGVLNLLLLTVTTDANATENQSIPLIIDSPYAQNL